MRTLTASAVIGGSALVLGSLGTAVAVSSSGRTVHVCAGKNGALRAASHCAKGERPITLGEQGPQGIQGPQGVAGLKGDTGATGVSGYYISTVQQQVTDPGTYTVTAECVHVPPLGDTPVAQGTVLGGGGSGAAITGEVPTARVPLGAPAAYAVTFAVSAPATLAAYAICATVS